MYATQAMSNHVQINILKKAMRSLHFHVSHFKYLYVSVLVGNACANMMTQYFSNWLMQVSKKLWNCVRRKHSSQSMLIECKRIKANENWFCPQPQTASAWHFRRFAGSTVPFLPRSSDEPFSSADSLEVFRFACPTRGAARHCRSPRTRQTGSMSCDTHIERKRGWIQPGGSMPISD